MAHPELEMATAAIEAISQLPEDQNRLYLDVVMTLLPARIRHILEARVLQGYKYQSEYALRYYNQGHEKGREVGRNEGREEGRNEGLRLAVLALARSRLEAVTDEDHAVIETIRDEHGLTELINALGRASSSSEARTAFALAISRLRDG
jgi:predicted transposase YdaD